jgi:hypothetical protein
MSISTVFTGTASCILMVATCVLMPISRAQQAPQVSLQFLSFPEQPENEPVELLISEGKTIKVDIPGNELSSVYHVPPLASIAVGKTTANEKGETAFQVYGNANSIAAKKQIILLIRKGEKNSDGFAVLPLDAQLNEFAGGNYLLINASKMQVGGTIGDKKFSLKPGQKNLLKPNASHTSGGCQVTLSYLKEEKWKVFYDTRWVVNTRYRSLIFFYQDPESGNLGVTPIMDFL